MSEQAFSFKDASLSITDLLPPEDSDDDATQETNARLAHYAQVAKLVDVEDIIEIVCASLKDSTQLRQSSPKLPLLQCGMKSALCLLHQFEERQLLGWGQTWASPLARAGPINYQ